MRQSLLAFSLCCLPNLASAQDSQPATEPTNIPVEVPVSAPSVVGLSVEPVPPARNMSFIREMRNTSGFSVNLIGLQNSFDVNWSKFLFDTDNALLAGAHIAFGLNNSTSPAYTRVGGWVEFSPLSIVDFRFGVEPTYYFGSFSTLINFESYASPYSEAAIAAIDDQSSPGFAGRAYFTPTFKVKGGPIIAASYADFELWKLFTDEVAPDFFYESQRDTLVDSSGDFVIQGANVLLYELNIDEAAGRKLIAGLNHEYLNVPGKDNGNRRQTLGLLAVANVNKTVGSLYKPTVILKVFTYLQDRNDLAKLNEFGAQFAFRFYIGEPRP